MLSRLSPLEKKKVSLRGNRLRGKMEGVRIKTYALFSFQSFFSNGFLLGAPLDSGRVLEIFLLS